MSRAQERYPQAYRKYSASLLNLAVAEVCLTKLLANVADKSYIYLRELEILTHVGPVGALRQYLEEAVQKSAYDAEISDGEA